MAYPISIVEHNQHDVTKIYDLSDHRFEHLEILSEHYYYHKPHNVVHKSLSENYRIIQCLFGVGLRENDEIVNGMWYFICFLF